jgi:hypothetical protein
LDHSDNAQQYRERARDMLASAELTTNDDQRRMMLAIAAMYHRLASEIEESWGGEAGSHLGAADGVPSRAR